MNVLKKVILPFKKKGRYVALIPPEKSLEEIRTTYEKKLKYLEELFSLEISKTRAAYMRIEEQQVTITKLEKELNNSPVRKVLAVRDHLQDILIFTARDVSDLLDMLKEDGRDVPTKTSP